MKRISHAQTGQDILIDFILRRNGFIPRASENYEGFYIDIGCAHPIKGSNTYFFYERGWTGLCIDANPLAEEPFKEIRPKDIFVNSGVGEEESFLDFYIFNNPQHNTFNPGRAKRHPDALQRVVNVKVDNLTSILSKNLPDHQEIDFLSMDIEGFELMSLRNLDLFKFRPKLIIVEALASIQNIDRSPVTKLLVDHDYQVVAHTGHDTIFLNQRTVA
ncbi:FkbM family methyltransferase [Roseococcus sp.]|uniref:FkbM family methyltransferase n=1 Tax=Roseococcus sp. TaxID=2109646 RepID=UPI003BA93C86